METPLISVIVPVYNVEKYLKRCICSIIEQSYKNLEIILVNDGSTDGSLLICEKYKESDKRILLVNKENGGLSDARNAGINASNGDYIAFMDSDDFWKEKDFISRFLPALVAEKDLITFRFQRCDENETKYWEVSHHIDEKTVNQLPYPRAIYQMLHNGSLEISACTKIVKRNILIDNNIFFEVGLLSEDIDWSLKLYLYIHSMQVFDEAGYVYRIRENSITRTVSKRNCDSLFSIIDKWSRLLMSEGNQEFQKAFLGYLSYQYYILLGFISINHLEKDMDLNKIEWIVKYSINYKTKICQILYRIFGRKIAGKIFAKYILGK